MSETMSLSVLLHQPNSLVLGSGELKNLTTLTRTNVFSQLISLSQRLHKSKQPSEVNALKLVHQTNFKLNLERTIMILRRTVYSSFAAINGGRNDRGFGLRVSKLRLKIWLGWRGLRSSACPPSGLYVNVRPKKALNTMKTIMQHQKRQIYRSGQVAGRIVYALMRATRSARRVWVLTRQLGKFEQIAKSRSQHQKCIARLNLSKLKSLLTKIFAKHQVSSNLPSYHRQLHLQ